MISAKTDKDIHLQDPGLFPVSPSLVYYGHALTRVIYPARTSIITPNFISYDQIWQDEHTYLSYTFGQRGSLLQPFHLIQVLEVLEIR